VIGDEIHSLAQTLWPINRSITGDGVRETLSILKRLHLPELKIHEVPTGTQAFDWVVPREWKVRDAYVLTPSGRRICCFKENNLHLVGYSVPVNMELSLEELNAHLHSLPDRPEAIPYVTSYYKEDWGFCLSHRERSQLEGGVYKVVIDSELFEGALTYGELVIRGESPREVFLSTFVCHPSVANNELSGPTVTTFIAKWLASLKSRRYTYRIVFVPETIGSITYLSRNLDWLREHVIAGFNVTCIGDDREYSYLPSRKGNAMSDIVAKHVLKWIDPSFRAYRWADRGSDERQYCSPGVDLPIASIMRTKYASYPEYHTSLDDLVHVVTPKGLEGGYNGLRLAIECIERHCYPKLTVLGEPQLGRRGLYPALSTPSSQVLLVLNLITWADGTMSLIDIADECSVPVWELYPLVDTLVQHGLLSIERRYDGRSCEDPATGEQQ
jgi:aminopeptidase-like protein